MYTNLIFLRDKFSAKRNLRVAKVHRISASLSNHESLFSIQHTHDKLT